MHDFLTVTTQADHVYGGSTATEHTTAYYALVDLPVFSELHTLLLLLVGLQALKVLSTLLRR